MRETDEAVARRPRVGAVTAVTAGVVAGLLAAGTTGAATAAPLPPADPESSAVARAAHAEPTAAGTPCSASARACVDLETQRAWLIHEGRVVRGPLAISTGGHTQPTPVGHSYRVYRKERDHVSGESRLPDGRPSPMPFSTFFADGGIAFHAGDPRRQSAGCVRMETADAEATFQHLRSGDKVQVVNGSVEDAARRPPPARP